MTGWNKIIEIEIGLISCSCNCVIASVQNFKGNYRDEEINEESNVDPFEFVETDVKQEPEDDTENLENSIICDIKQEPDYFDEDISDPKGLTNFTT